MKIQLISDTHTYSVEISEEADLVVHAGDIGNGHIGHILNFVDACKNKNKDYVLVLGNHDFYGLQKISNVYKELDKYNINYLTAGKEFNYKGFTFVGGVFFTDFTLNAEGPWDIDKNKSNAKRSISDFFEILNDKNQFITPEEYITLHNIDWNWIQQYRNKPNTVVITHFPPNPVALSPYWKKHGGSLNSYFINTKDLTGFKYWLAGHCVDLQTEILTESGWKFRKDLLLTDKIYTYNPVDKILELKNILKITDIKYTGDVYLLNAKSANQRVTNLHRMVGYNLKKQYTVYTAEFLALKKSPFNLIKSGIFLPHSGISLSDNLLELYIAINADGNLATKNNLIRFKLFKNTKKQYIVNLLESLNISYKIYNYNGAHEGKSSINFYLPSELDDWCLKGLDNKLLNCNNKQFELILKAYSNTDGTKRNSGYSIYTAKKVEVDLLSHLATINGYSCSIYPRYCGFGNNLQYQLYISQKQWTQIEKPNTLITKEKVINEDFWCITILNENFFIRRNNKISLTGNCHDAFDKEVDGCRVINNAYGYKSEQNLNGYVNKLLIEISCE